MMRHGKRIIQFPSIWSNLSTKRKAANKARPSKNFNRYFNHYCDRANTNDLLLSVPCTRINCNMVHQSVSMGYILDLVKYFQNQRSNVLRTDRILSGNRNYDGNNKSSTTATWIMACSPLNTTKHSLSFIEWFKRWIQRCWKRLRKIVFVTIRLSGVAVWLFPLTILIPVAVISSSRGNRLTSSLPEKLAWQYTIYVIQQLGPVAIKFSQWASTRRDIFPPYICDRLSILQDRGYPHSSKWTKHVLQQSFGDYESKGLTIKEVVGCGSAAQVYRDRKSVV